MRCTTTALALAVTLGLTTISHPVAAGDTELGGKMYFDVTHIGESTSDGGRRDDAGFGIDVKRFYITVDHGFDPVWSVNLTTDMAWSSSDGMTGLFVKKAYLQGAFSRAAVLRIGSADLPWVSFVDKASGFRYVEKSLVDRMKFGTSADWGLHLGGKLGAAAPVDYALSVVNGRGYKDPGRSGRVDVEARVALAPVDGLLVAVGGYSGTLGETRANPVTWHTARRLDAMAAWVTDHVRVGAEWFRADNWNTVVLPASDAADGWSTWASGQLTDTLTLFGRYDRTRPSRDLDPRSDADYFHVGVALRMTKGVDLALAWKHTRGNETAGSGEDAHLRRQRGNEIGVWGQVSF